MLVSCAILIAAGLPELIRPFADLIFQTLLHRPLHCSDVRHGQRMANKRLTETGTEENSADGPTVGVPPELGGCLAPQRIHSERFHWSSAAWSPQLGNLLAEHEMHNIMQ